MFYVVTVLIAWATALVYTLLQRKKPFSSWETLITEFEFLNADWRVSHFLFFLCCAISTILLLLLLKQILKRMPRVRWTIQLFEKYSKEFVLNVRIVRWLLPIGALFVVCHMVSNSMVLKNVPRSAQWYEQYHYIAHAAGGLEHVTLTNTKEAFETNYQKGYRVFEIDMCHTADGVLVAEHDWRTFCIQTDEDFVDSDIEPTVSYDTFIQTKKFGQYTTMDMYDLMEKMLKYKDVYIVTDVKTADREEVVRAIAQLVRRFKEEGHTDLLDRIIVQLYTFEMLEPIREIHDFDHYIFTCYMAPPPQRLPENVVPFCVQNNIPVITMYKEGLTDEMIETAKEKGVRVYTHTVNDAEEEENYVKQGVWGIYTDYLINTDFNIEE